jgi:hypothetical protein
LNRRTCLHLLAASPLTILQEESQKQHAIETRIQRVTEQHTWKVSQHRSHVSVSAEGHASIYLAEAGPYASNAITISLEDAESFAQWVLSLRTRVVE